MLHIADQFRHIVGPALWVGASLLVVLLAALIVGRLFEDVRIRRRQRVISTCRPFIENLMLPSPPAGAVDQLRRQVSGHEDVLAHLLVGPARFAAGSVIDQLRLAARTLGLIDRWVLELAHRRWWVRAEAARALGLLREGSAVASLLDLLDDEHEEVRAAGIDALGHLADAHTVPVLVSKLPDESRHQRVRVVEALRRFGSDAVPALLAYEREHPADRAVIAELLGVIADPSALDDLVRWSDDERPAVRVAAMQAIGSIGLDRRTYYYALRALTSDSSADVRAMGARALGRGRTRDAVLYLAKHLHDEWTVAAHSARALRTLGEVGAAALREQAETHGPAGDLARQMLFEIAAEGRRRRAVA